MQPTAPKAPLVGLYSPVPQSGKSTLSAGLAGFGWSNVKFAGPLKAMIRALLVSAGERPETVERMVEGDLKEVPAALLAGNTPRWAMQTLGAEWGRSLLGENLWVAAAMGDAYRLRSQGVAVVIDDMRYPNEAQAVRDAGGALVKIVRPGLEKATTHSSEGALDAWDFDLVIENTAPGPREFVLDWAPGVSSFAWTGQLRV